MVGHDILQLVLLLLKYKILPKFLLNENAQQLARVHEIGG